MSTRFVKSGDKVSQFDQICEVQSDKASVTITSRYDGLIKILHYNVDDVALVGNPLLDIELDDDDSNSPDPTPESTEPITQHPIQEKKIHNHDHEKMLTTPAVRRIAAENSVNLKDVLATGKAGRVLKEDILAYLENKSNKTSEKSNQIKEKNTKENEFEIVALKGYEKHMWKSMTKSIAS